MKYRKKPVVIDAWQLPVLEYEDITFSSEELLPPKWFVNGIKKGVISLIRNKESDYLHLSISTLEGTMTANPLDYIIRGITDELYPCKPDIFEKTYEPVED